ncbi:MAG: hypothetical protein QOE23_428 [Pseudonocardiales bacterium]|jgi:hypothetical protein|nr:hypothetical protein [Pseudonocardiales bacterium]
METATLERLQQLPAEDEAEYMQCALTCTYSCFSTDVYSPCDITGFIT